MYFFLCVFLKNIDKNMKFYLWPITEKKSLKIVTEMFEMRFKNLKRISANFRVCHALRGIPRYARDDLGEKWLEIIE